MPVLYSVMIVVNINKDKTISLIKNEINKCGCVTADALINKGETLRNIKDALNILTLNKELVCQDNVCCESKEKLAVFINKLRVLRGDV
jgi:hypothetical protein